MTRASHVSGFRGLPLVLALLLLAGCATPFRAHVSRFQVMPPPQGERFVIEPAGSIPSTSLEFRTYAATVETELRRIGMTPAADRSAATVVVRLDYGLGPARERVDTRLGWGPWGPGFGPGWGGFYGWGGFGGFGPAFGPGFGNEVYSYTVFPSFVSVSINRAGDGLGLFEGRAEATTRKGDLPNLVPKLVTALFTGFPGNSGETVVVRVREPGR